ncbi:MAG: glycosyltransferase family 4 protein [Candidatus Hydrothermales bacterium]
MRLIKKQKPDLVIFFEESYSTSAFEFAIIFRDVPFVFFSLQNINKKFPLPIKLLQSYVFKKSKGALISSQEGEQVLREWGYDKEIFKFYLGVDPKNFEKAEKFPIIEELERPIFSYIGRLTKKKGIYILVSAFEKFYEKFRKGTLLFVGEGEEKENLIKELKLKRLNFYILPYVSHEKIYSVYKSIDFLVLPSITTRNWKEQFGRVLVEAMCAKVPVIGSDSGAIPEVIGDAGLIFKESDSVDLFKSMERLYLDENLRKHFVEKGFKRVKENFTYEVIAERLYNFLKSLI